MPTIKVSYFNSPVGDLILGSYNDSLCLCDWNLPQRRARIDRRICRHLNATYDICDSTIVSDAITQLSDYFSGNLTQFTIPIELAGTEFQRSVWNELMTLPFGTTTSYAEVACRINNPNAVRAVATAIADNAVSIFVPCHRVIGSNHTLVGYAGGLETKRSLLLHESSIRTKLK